MPEKMVDIAEQREQIRLKRIREGVADQLLTEQRLVPKGHFVRFPERQLRWVFESNERLVVMDEHDEPVAVVVSPLEYEVLCQYERAHVKR